jgi:two-component system phosphate regulon sensor histidine kinase PhoR
VDGSRSRERAPGRAGPGWTLARRLVLSSVLGLVGVLAALAVPLDRYLEHAFLADLTDQLSRDARTVRALLPADGPSDGRALEEAVRTLGADLGVRVTVIRIDGVVLADSERDPETLANHRDRPEVRAALAGHVGVASRTSASTGRPYRYVALPPERDRIVRVALPIDWVERRLGRVRAGIASGAILALAVVAGGAWALARRIARPLEVMRQVAAAVGAGDPTARIPEAGPAELVDLAATVNRMADELGRRVEEAREERRLRDLVLAAMEEGVVLVSPAGEPAYANPAALRLLGRVEGRAEPYLAPLLRNLVETARAAGGPEEAELELGPDPRTVRASALPVGAGEVLLILRDVTEARRLDRVRRDFVAAASHELKTPVASIQAAAETLGHAIDEDPAAARRFAEHLRRDAERLSRIVADLLDLSRLESQPIEREPVSLDEVAREEADRAAERAVRAGLALEVATVPATVRGSRSDLALLVTNLLDNAIRYTRPGGRIRVEVARVDDRVTLSVSDTGIGIPARDLPRIFERFYRVDRARSRETGGTGLGLAIVKHVAELHGGRVEASSELGRGSTFTVTLPAA